MEEKIFLIFNDSMDDCATIVGYIKGTEKDADRYVEEHNSACDREWKKVWWEELKKLN